MAFLSLSMIDSFGRTTKKLVELETQVDLAAYQAAAVAYLAALQAVTDLGVVRADLIIDAISAGFAVTAGANVDVGATFSGLITDGNGKKASLKLPGIKLSLVDADGSVDVEDVTVAAWLAQYLAAGAFMLSDGETIASWLAGILDK
jgi:hypothetical protein